VASSRPSRPRSSASVSIASHPGTLATLNPTVAPRTHDISLSSIDQARQIAALAQEKLAREPLKYDAVVTGVRAYNVHPWLWSLNKKLLDYIVRLPEGEISAAFGEPEWADQYWTMKSSLTAPGYVFASPYNGPGASGPLIFGSGTSSHDVTTWYRRAPSQVLYGVLSLAKRVSR